MSRAAAMQMARLSGADEFVSKLPRGYDTHDRGTGGQISPAVSGSGFTIAGAFTTNPPILILDEATSALDYESERIVPANARVIVQGRTVLIIAHRLATVRHCDRIIGMKDSRIAEEGTHETLLARQNGLYTHLWQ